MRIRFNEISPHGNQFKVDSIDGLDGAGIYFADEQFQASFELKRKNDNQVEMHGTIHAELNITCDRCLQQFSYPLATQYHIVFELNGVENWQLKEIECSAEELDTVLLNEPVVDVDDILRQQVLLATPTKQLCDESCKGLCSVCGVNLNTDNCECEPGITHSPFAALAGLKAKK